MANIDITRKLSSQQMHAIEGIFGKLLENPPPRGEGGPEAPLPGPAGDTGVNLEKLPLPVVWGVSHAFSLILHGQEDAMWCGQATVQMILEYYHYYYEQVDILNLHTTWEGIFAIPSHNYLKGVEQYDPPTWDQITSELDQNQPFASCIQSSWYSHVRPCAGYHWVRFPPGSPYATKRFLFIYDPEPANSADTFCNPQGGSEYWEDCDAYDPQGGGAVVYGGPIYVRPCKGTMSCT